MATTTNGTRNTNRRQRAGQAAANAGAAAGGFVGGLGSSFIPPVNINVNKGSKYGSRGGPGGRHGGMKLPEAEFTSPAQVRNYCNTGRSLMVGLSFEVDMAAAIMQATLAQVPDPEGSRARSIMRARKVSRQMKRAAADAKAAAKHFAACYAAFQREYDSMIRPHRVRQAQTGMNWRDQ